MESLKAEGVGRDGAERAGIAVVVPTLDRPASVDRLLTALARQERVPDDVILVDAGTTPLHADALRRTHPALTIRHIPARPGVCAQRNTGIRAARHRYILLCDDDIEPPPDYLRRLEAFLDAKPEVGAVTGLLLEPGPDGRIGRGVDAPALRHLLFAFLFQVSVWGDVEGTEAGLLGRPPLAGLRRWYRRRGNTFSAAGWPLFTQVRGPVTRTAVYGLGAALVRRAWLLRSPFDEGLGPHGIGDNYGVALGFPGDRPIHVLTDLPVRHHRAPENRLAAAESRFRRVLALDYFVRSDSRFPRRTTAALAWSLVGSIGRSVLRRRYRDARREARALALVVTGRNPLLRRNR